MNYFDFDKIPDYGFVYFESDTLVFVEQYNVSDGQLICKHADNILKSSYRTIDFFDEQINARYKCIDGVQNIEQKGSVQNIEQKFSCSDKEEKNPLLFMEEELLLEHKYRFEDYSKIRINNRFYFDENNVIHFKNYRLVTLL